MVFELRAAPIAVQVNWWAASHGSVTCTFGRAASSWIVSASALVLVVAVEPAIEGAALVAQRRAAATAQWAAVVGGVQRHDPG